MGKKFQILFALLVFALAALGLWVGLGWRQLGRPEPVFQGKPLSYWLAGYENYSATNAPTRSAAEMAVQQMGTNALPVLLRMLAAPDTSLQDDFFMWIQKQHFIKTSPPMNSQRKHFIALWGITAMHKNASNAVPELIRIFDRNPNQLARQIVPAILSAIGPPAKAAIPQLLRGLADTNENVRFNSISALGQIGAEPDLIVPTLIHCLHDSAPAVRGSAARALGAFGKDARSAVPALGELLKEEQTKLNGASGGGGSYGWMVGASWPSRSSGLLNFDVASAVADALAAIAPEPVDGDASVHNGNAWGKTNSPRKLPRNLER